MFWDGTRWVDERRSPPRPRFRPGRLVNALASIPVLILVPVLLMPYLAASASAPSIAVSGVAVPGGTLSVTGAGWPNRLTLQLAWDGKLTGMPRARTGGTGEFATTITVPSNASAAAHTLTAMTAKNGNVTKASSLQSAAALSASISITVQGSAPDPGATAAATARPTAAPTRAPAPTAAAPAPTPGSDPTAPPATPPDPTASSDPTAPTDPPAATDPPSGPQLAFDAECGGSGMDPAFKPFNAAGDPGFDLDADLLSTLQQVSVANGYCTITAARMSTPSGRPYGSAMFSTYGSFGQAYGTFEARVRYPAGQGVWPGFFLLPVGQKVPYPEIDIFEAYPAPPGAGGGSGVNVVVSTLHWASGGNKYIAADMGINMTSAFHTHRLVWSPGKLVFSIDGTVTGTITTNVPSGRMYPIFDLALGAPGYRIDGTTPSSLRMDIDYLRVWTP